MDPALIGAGLAALTPMAALLTVAGIHRGRQKKRRRAAMKAIDVPGSRRDLALIIAMGGDPQKHRITVVRKGVKGLRLVDDEGRPVRFLSERQLRSPDMRARFKAAERTNALAVEGA